MPKDDTQQQPTVNSQPSTAGAPPPPPTIPTDDMDQPPMVPPTDASSVAPANDVVMPATTPMETTPITTLSPKKKFAGGRVIATILGLFLLVGGIGAGVLLVGQNQNPNEQAAGGCATNTTRTSCESSCHSDLVSACVWRDGECKVSGQACGGGGGGGACTPSTCPECNGGSYPSRCTFLGDKECQTDTSGNNTGYECTCTDLSPRACWQYQWSCGAVNTNTCPIEGTPPGPNDYCSATTCSVTLSPTCWVSHYRSNDNDDQTVNDIVIAEHVASATLGATDCGAEQIDVRCGLANDSISRRYENDCGENPPPGEPTPTPAPITAQCQNVQAYSETFTLLTDAQLAALRPADEVNFCVAGVATGGSFDRARFTINGVLQPETTTIRPGSTDFCQLYTIPAGTTTFNVTAEIHHVTLGWK